jgi:transcriptional regulator with XRE-family HTH domain
MTGPDGPRLALGAFIRSQRELADLSLRQVAALADISNPYLSQIERGLHQPSLRVMRSIAQALNLSAESLLEQAGMLERDPEAVAKGTEAAIRADDRLTDQQKQALLAVYRTYCATNEVEGIVETPD